MDPTGLSLISVGRHGSKGMFVQRGKAGSEKWEKRGVRMSVAELQVKYRAPARYELLI